MSVWVSNFFAFFGKIFNCEIRVRGTMYNFRFKSYFVPCKSYILLCSVPEMPAGAFPIFCDFRHVLIKRTVVLTLSGLFAPTP